MVAGRVEPGASIGVVAFYDGVSGDYTALGDQWRGRVTGALAENGSKVKSVRDMELIIDVLEQADKDFSEGDFWRRSGSDYLLVGNYYINSGAGNGAADYIELNLKLLRVKDQQVAGAGKWRTKLQPGWQAKSATIRGNKYQKAIEVIGPGGGRTPGPPLTAMLDRKPPCYPAGAKVSLTIKSKSGVYLYILNVAADNSVTINYPNAYLTGRPLVSAEFVFPPPELPNLSLILYPLPDENPSREAFKIIASYKPLDFSFLKVPDGQIYAGAKAAELKKVLAVLQKSSGWSEVTLPYLVGRGCEQRWSKGVDCFLELCEKTLSEIRQATNRSWLLGSEQFCESIKPLSNRQMLPKARGGNHMPNRENESEGKSNRV